MKPILLVSFLLASIPIPAFAADHTEQVAGWALKDTGGKPGDDSEREVSLSHSVPGVEVIYRPGTGTGGSVEVKLSGCDHSYSFSSGFQFDDKVSRTRTVRDEVDEAFVDFAKNCPFKDGADKKAMEGFDTAFGAVEKWVKDKPFVYPPEDQSAPDAEDKPGEDDGDQQPAPNRGDMI